LNRSLSSLDGIPSAWAALFNVARQRRLRS
jgi:hypothetical protein